jgi:hypothetical protein
MDSWNAPVAISKVRIGKQEILPGSSFEAADDWDKDIVIEGINRSEKTISYIAYDLDFTIAGETSLYRVRLQDGLFYLLPDALTSPESLSVSKGQKHESKFVDNALSCQASVTSAVKEKRAKIVKVELFVESVGFKDDTLWSFGSNLTHNKANAVFENLELRRLADEKKALSNHVGGTAPKMSFTSYEPFKCCVPVFVYMTVPHGANPISVNQACSSCPPSAGGGSCFPIPMKNVNSLGSGQGNNIIMMTGFTEC